MWHSLLGQFIIPLATADTCLLPDNTYLTWITDATEPRAGEVYYAEGNTYINAYLASSTEDWIRNALLSSCAQQTPTDTIALHIERLRMAEAGGNGRVSAAVFLDLCVLHRTSTVWRVCYRAKVVVNEQANAGDLDRHARMVLRALGQCLHEYGSARDTGKLVDEAYSRGKPEGAFSRYPILNMPPLPKGVFSTLDAFRNADIEPVAEDAIGFDKRHQALLKGTLAQRKDAIWALSDGANLHINVDGTFLPLNFTGTHFTTTVRQEVQDQRGRVAVGFGYMGYGVMATIPKKEYVQARLDLSTGLLVPEGGDAALLPAIHVIKLSRFTDESLQLQVFFRNSSADLERDAYCELALPVGAGNELLRLRCGEQEVRVALDNSSPGSHLHVIEIIDGRPLEKHLPPTTEEQMLEQLNKEMLRPLKPTEQ
ncbi:MAG TPA: hypothetical protein PK760_08355 [Flavobacteriales bacterium]|nr:hypothetical protein [Flavobacteriales bacterium]